MDENERNELRQKIQEVLTDGQTKLSEVTAIADGAKQKETELNTFHTRIIELKAAAETNSNSLAETLNNANTVKSQIDELHRVATEAKNAIDVFHQNSNAKNDEINNYYNIFQNLKQQVENPEFGLAQTLAKATEFFGHISKTNTDATAAKDEILTNKVKSDGLLNETNQLKDNIANNLTESERLKTEIGKILDLVRDTGLANSFDKRRKRSQWSSLFALGVIILGVIISVITISKVFLSEEGQNLFSAIQNDYIKFLLRLTLTAPGVFTAWFGAAQYSKERYFLEQYEFKTAAALALENYTKLLKDNYAGKEEEIFKLNLELIRSVYKEPIFIKPKTSIFARVKEPTTKIKAEKS
ncbi:MAG: hypothetical protein KF900_10060 [Bacteroidetes bacterium]|nr:hypothetical protein [Bacteroidota bacterium]